MKKENSLTIKIANLLFILTLLPLPLYGKKIVSISDGVCMPVRLQRISEYKQQSINAIDQTLDANAEKIVRLADAACDCLDQGGKILLFGNGGSAADAQHLAAEFVNRYLFDREEMAALALTTDTSVITSISNDYGYDLLFAKQIRALARPGDLAVGLSTSGTSKNVLLGLQAAQKIGCVTAGFCGSNSSAMDEVCTYVLPVNHASTPIVQQVHILMGHLLAELVEAKRYGRSES